MTGQGCGIVPSRKYREQDDTSKKCDSNAQRRRTCLSLPGRTDFRQSVVLVDRIALSAGQHLMEWCMLNSCQPQQPLRRVRLLPDCWFTMRSSRLNTRVGLMRTRGGTIIRQRMSITWSACCQAILCKLQLLLKQFTCCCFIRRYSAHTGPARCREREGADTHIVAERATTSSTHARREQFAGSHTFLQFLRGEVLFRP